MFLNGNCSSLVTNWRFYDSVYTERYAEPKMQTVTMTTSINHVNKLKGFFLIHGSGDDNVHVQNSMQMMEALIQANKQFDLKFIQTIITVFTVEKLEFNCIQND
jgi:dipeptidyl aminopeptidase/acylaminoacyl peptidase